MATCRVQAVFQGGGPAGFPEDRVVNTFHFADVGPGDEAYFAGCRELVSNFYTTQTTGVSIGLLMSPWINRTATVQSYDLAVAPGARVPTVETFTLESAGAFLGMPEEVALVCTLKGDPPDTARRRGRIYLGPFSLNGLAQVGATNTVPARPNVASSQGIVRVAADRCIDLANQTAIPRTWVIRSTVPVENFVPITNGHIDNAWDTQRRRGPATTARTLWT